MHANSYLQISTTCDDRKALERLAQLLVSQQLAACVQLSGPIQSYYRWEGKLEVAEEWLLQAKTRDDLQTEVFERISANHPYQLPQLTATRLEHLSSEYAAWMDASLKKPD